MNGSMYLAAAGALVQQLRLETLANNVANINTSGYKKDTAVFRVADANVRPTAPAQANAIQPLSPYAPPFATIIDFSQGAVRQTGNPLDVALSGDGFFSIQTPEGVQYTRQGSFTLDDQGRLVSPDGYPVLGEAGEIVLDEGPIEIDTDGGIHADGNEVGRLQITAFDNRTALKKVGNGRFAPVEAGMAGKRPELTTLQQGYIETANVNPVREMTAMIEASRAFEAYQKVIQSTDEATAKSINDVGKTA